MVYKSIKLNLSANQLNKVRLGKPIRLSAAQIGTGSDAWLHPVQHEKVLKAHRKNKGCSLHLTEGEILATHEKGSGLFSSILKGVKSGFNWVKANWNELKPLASKLADAAVPAAVSYGVDPRTAMSARQLLKETTGVGLKTKPGKRKPAGKSFLLN